MHFFSQSASVRQQKSPQAWHSYGGVFVGSFALRRQPGWVLATGMCAPRARATRKRRATTVAGHGSFARRDSHQ